MNFSGIPCTRSCQFFEGLTITIDTGDHLVCGFKMNFATNFVIMKTKYAIKTILFQKIFFMKIFIK